MTVDVRVSDIQKRDSWRFVLAALFPLAACGLQWLFWDAIQPFAWILFYPAVFFSSWVGGLRGGLVATVLSTGLVWYCFLPPQFSLAVQRPMAYVSMATFAGMGVLFSLLHGRLRKANHEAAQAMAATRSAKGQLEDQVLERTADLQQSNAALRSSEQEFRTLAEAMPQIVWITRPDGWNIYFNQQWVDYTGLTLEASYGHGWSIPFHPDDRQRAQEAWQQATATGGTYELEGRLRRADGAYRWWLIRGLPLRDGEGKILKWFGTCTDIENIKQAEAALRESNERFRTLVDTVPAAIFIQTNSCFAYVNAAALQLFGATQPAELIGQPVVNRTHPDYRASARERIQMLNERRERAEASDMVFITLDGSVRNVITSAVPFNYQNQNGALVFVIDITERKRGEVETRRLLAAVQQEKDRLASLVNSISDEVWFADTDKRFTLANPSARREFALDAAAGIGVEQLAISLEVLRPDGTARPAEESPALRALNGEVVRDLEEMIRTPASGELRYRQVNSSPVRDAQGAIIGSVSVVRDITERKRAEHQLIESEQRYRALFENMSAGFVLFEVVQDDQGVPVDLIILAANRGFEITTGLKNQEVIGQRLTRVLPGIEKDAADWISIYGKVGLIGESRHFEQGSGLLGVHCSVTAYQAAPKQCAVTFVDITERKRAEEALQKQNRLIQTILAHAPIGFAVNTINDGAFQYVNTRFEEIYGVPRGALRSVENFFELVYPDPVCREALRARIMADIATGDPARMCWEDVAFTARTGESKVVTAVNIPLPDQNLMVSTVIDVTHRKRAEAALQESEERFRTMANAIPQLAWIAKADGFIFWYNQRWHDYTGTTPRQMEGWGWQSVHDPKVLPSVLENWKGAIAAGRPFEMEFPLRGADGQFRNFLTRGQPLKDSQGRVMQWFGTNTDVDELKRAEEKVRLLNTELEQRVSDRTAKLRAANEELEAFSYSVSHDLRTPLRHLHGYAEMLAREAGDGLSEKGQHCLKIIADAS